MQEDPEFEKQVRQRMEELQFTPSKAVWDNLEKEITKEKRRRMPLLWFSFLAALLLGGTFYFLPKTTDNRHAVTQAGQNDTPNSSKQEKTPSNTANDQNTTLTEHSKNQTEKINKPAVIPDRNTDQSLAKNNRHATTGVRETHKKIDGQREEEVNDLDAIAKISKNKKSSGANPKNDAANDRVRKDIVDEQLSANKDDHAYVTESDKSNDVAAAATPAATNSNKADTIAQKTVTETKTTPEKNIAQTKKQKNKKPWEFGFSGGAGVSSMNENLFNTAVQAPANAYTQSFSLAAAPPAPIYNTPSSISPGFSYSAGIVVQKEIRKRFIFSTGLNYHYASAKMNVRSYGYYAAAAQTRIYTNRYHFLELPVSLSYQFTKSQRFPLFWEAGVSVSQLIGSDAMHYNSSTGAYYKDNSLFNKTQFNAATAVMVGFHANKHLYFQVGPQIQYGITNLLTSDASGSQHLFFGGIKFVFIPNKK